MKTMNKPLTIKDLKALCEQEIQKGHGDYSIMLSNDDEGNDFHYCWYAFTTVNELAEDGLDVIYSLDERIAPKDKTIILG